MLFGLPTSLILLSCYLLSVTDVPGCSLAGTLINLTSGVRGFLSSLQETREILRLIYERYLLVPLQIFLA